MEFTIAGTGHRPKDLGIAPDVAYTPELVNLCHSALLWFRPTRVISGLALGWDLALAEAARREKIPLLAAIPFQGQENRWRNPNTLKTYYELRDYAAATAGVVVVCDGAYAPWKMQVRNRWMVDRCDLLLALWSGKRQGGTYNCLSYAWSKSVDWANVWPDYQKICNEAHSSSSGLQARSGGLHQRPLPARRHP